MKKWKLVAIAVAVTCQAYTQVQWPAITQTARPWTRWWWEGSAVDKKNLSTLMRQYKAAGLGGLEITPIYGVKGHEDKFLNFLSPQWLAMLDHTLAEAKQLGLGIDLANATGWPFGGPWVSQEDACKNVQVKTYALKTGESVQEPIRFTQQPFYRSESRQQVDMKKLLYPVTANPNLQQYAFDQVRYEMELKPFIVMAYGDKGESIDITNKLDGAGKLNWAAPAGNWTVFALFTGWHGKMVERAAPGGEGNVIDHFNKTALVNYLQRFDKAFAGKDLSGLRSFFNDSYEVDDARGQGNWTPLLLQEFKKRRGYELQPYFPLLFSRDSTEKGRRVLSDYRQTISDLVLDNFTIPWQQWAASKKKMVRNQSHGSPSNILDLYAVVDIPETEGTDILRFKFATSTANVTGKRLAAAESATWLNEHFQSSWGDVKQAVDKYFVGGVNHVVWHGTNYSPEGEAWPGWLFYAAVHFTPANPLWKDFSTLNQYVAKCQSFLQQGKPDNDVLLYFPFHDRQAEMGRDMLHHFDGMAGFENTGFKGNGEWMLKNGYAFDLVSDKQVQAMKIVNGQFQSAANNYKTIVVSDVKYMPIETMRYLRSAAEQGATVIFYKKTPGSVPGLSGLKDKQAELDRLYNALRFEDKAGVKKATIGKGMFLIGDDLSRLLQASGIRRESMADAGLQFVRRKLPKGDCYFISNPNKQAIDTWVPLSTKGIAAVLYDPMSGHAGVANTKRSDNELQIRLQLEAGESRIIQVSTAPVKGELFPAYEKTTSAIPLTGSWTIEFIKGGPVLPRSETLQQPVAWTELKTAGVGDFSGTAAYTIHFNKPEPADFYLLDLGNVYESAEVLLNGKSITTLLGPVYQTVIPGKLLNATNELRVLVTNGMANRIAYLDRNGVVWKKFYNTNFPSRLPQNRDANNLFTAVGWPVKRSGLSGPVTITPLKKQDR